MTKRYSAGLVFFLLVTAAAFSQERFTTLKGTVRDATGSAIPGAKVDITNKDTRRSMSVQTGGDGEFIARQLEPGLYTVDISAGGFQKYSASDVQLVLGKEFTLLPTLQVGQTETTIEVTESAPLIDTTGVTITNNISSAEFDRLPKARSFQSLIVNSPSVNTGQIEGGFQINGASGSENQFFIDGISTNSLVDGRSRQNAAFEFLQEVQVKTGGIEAEYGGAMGGVVSAVTKSGSNQFHGEAHYYYTGNRIGASPVKRLLLDPNDESTVSFVQDAKNPLDLHEFGGSLGGYLLKNRLWFYGSYSPQLTRRSNSYLFSNGSEPFTIDQKQANQQLFGKVSGDITPRLRANASWLWTPTRSTGRLPAYDGISNAAVASLESNRVNQQVGFSSPQSNYNGQVDWTMSSRALVTVRAGRFWDNFKTIGVPDLTSVIYGNSATDKPNLNIPPQFQLPMNSQNTPRLQNTAFDITTRTYVQGDFSILVNKWGMHDLKIGGGRQRTVNKVDVAYPQGGYAQVFWDTEFRQQRGTYGYYAVNDIGTRGSTGGTINNIYIQDRWRMGRLTLNLGVRFEDETVPSFLRGVKDPAFSFGFTDKISPRAGIAFDMFGNGRLKLYSSFGRMFDWVKYDLSRGTFGGDFWHIYYRSLDNPDVFNINGNARPGRNLWAGGEFRDLRLPSFDAVPPDLKPMSTDLFQAGVEYQLTQGMVMRINYTYNHLVRTIEDLGALVDGSEAYLFANPGEGQAKFTTISGGTVDPISVPRAVRNYDALEFTLARRFSNRWFGSASYVYSRLYGNYAGLGNSDEISTPTTGVSSATTQQLGGSVARPGTNGTRNWDLDEAMFDSHGAYPIGRLATDRPHVVKLYGSYLFGWRKWGSTDIGGFFYGGSGTPLSTTVQTQNNIPVFVNGRGDMGRTPFLTQTDVMVGHNFKFGEIKTLRFEFNAQNIFNQKTSRHRFNSLNRGSGLERPSSAIDLSHTDLHHGYDYNALIRASEEGNFAYDPRYGLDDLFNPGFQGRFLVKFMF